MADLRGRDGKSGWRSQAESAADKRSFKLWQESDIDTNDHWYGHLMKCTKIAIQTELTPKQQEMVLLYFVEGFTIPQIAKMKGLHKSTVSRTLQRAKIRLLTSLRFAHPKLMNIDPKTWKFSKKHYNLDMRKKVKDGIFDDYLTDIEERMKKI